MDKKVILISIDGMRPDGVQKCGNPFVEELKKISSYTFNSRTVEPSVTLPCHMSLFHSVTPSRHGILTNTYVPQVRPINGLFERVSQSGGTCAFFYGWEPLRDVARPGSLKWANYTNAYTEDSSDTVLTDACIDIIKRHKPDFVFLYMVETDEKGGHDNGWMTDAYLGYVSTALSNAKRVYDLFGDEYTIIITADHGGHDRSHGSLLDEDMTIPQFYIGKDFEKGKVLEGVSILDTTPTIAKVMGIIPEQDWEGKPII